MDMKSEITGVSTVEVSSTKAALIKLDTALSQERLNWVYNRATVEGFTSIKLHTSHSDTRVIHNLDGEPMGLVSDGWIIAVDHNLGGLLIHRNSDCVSEDLDLENDWIDVLMLLKNFFMLGRDEEADFNRYL